jgi:hypothetical protein
MNDLAKRESLAVQPSGGEPESSGMMQLYRMAIEGKCTVETIRGLREIHVAEKAAQAKREFDDAMAAFQAECPVILRTVAGAQNKYSFAPLDHIVVTVKPMLSKHGFSYTFDSDCDNTSATAIIIVKHSGQGGCHAETSRARVPIDSRNTLMSPAQAVAGALTFAKRYAFCNAFGIHTAGEDKDGQVPQIKGDPMKRKTVPGDTKALLTELWETLETVRGDQDNWKIAQRWLVDECAIDVPVNKMSADELRLAISKVKGKL